jgi:hypothetical protein
MYRIERQHEGPTRGHWLPVKGATYRTREEAATALRETMAAELRRAAAEGRSKTERFRIALAVAACMVMQ